MKRLLSFAILLALCGGAFVWYRSQTAPKVQVTPFAQLPKIEQQKRRAKAQGVVEQIETIARDTKRGERKTFKVVLSQDELNTLLQDRLKAKGLPISNPRIGLQNGQLIVEADGKYKGLSAPVSLSGTATAKKGEVSFTIDSMSLGGFPVPGNLKPQIQRAVNDGLKKALAQKGTAQIESVEISDGAMTIQGRTG